METYSSGSVGIVVSIVVLRLEQPFMNESVDCDCNYSFLPDIKEPEIQTK